MQTLRSNASTTSSFGSLSVQPAPERWKEPCAHTECTLHQLSPYIGKIKSSIAGELVERYSKPGDLVADCFAGAGTIPLEAAIRGRRVFGADISPYARILSTAKLSPPASLDEAIRTAEEAFAEAHQLQKPDLRSVPNWVKRFFHADTLRETLTFAAVCRRPGNEFLMACLLGILHHQRPGFLSFPSSHLVPYLRSRKYPRESFPEMYSYRELRPRLLAKIKRSYKRFVKPPPTAIAAFKSIREEAGEFLRNLKGSCEHGDKLVAIASAFGVVANSYLRWRDSTNEKGAPPWQACRIEPHQALSLSASSQKLYDELLRYSVFIEDDRGKSRRGKTVPRLCLRRFLIPYFNLTFSGRDSIPLEPADIELLLTAPGQFEDKFRRRGPDEPRGGDLPFG